MTVDEEEGGVEAEKSASGEVRGDLSVCMRVRMFMHHPSEVKYVGDVGHQSQLFGSHFASIPQGLSVSQSSQGPGTTSRARRSPSTDEGEGACSGLQRGHRSHQRTWCGRQCPCWHLKGTRCLGESRRVSAGMGELFLEWSQCLWAWGISLNDGC